MQAERIGTGRRRAALHAIAQILAGLALAAGPPGPPATAQWKTAPPASVSDTPFGVLQGRWVRPDGGYDGSTYTLAYDAANDVLKGVYFRAVAQQQFNVTFMRAR